MDNRELKLRARDLKPVMSIGKNGITEGAIKQLDIDLETKQLIKVKLLKTFLDSHDKKEVAEQLALMTKSKIVQIVGHTVILYRT
jgi:RNA-binding protein